MKNRLLAVATLALFAITALKSANVITEKSIDAIIGKMTLEQKARMLVGTSGRNSGISHIVPGAAGWTFEIPSLGIPSINLADGPVGIRINPVPSQRVTVVYDASGIPVERAVSGSGENEMRTFCTCFPSTTALAATWNHDAASLQGSIMADEAHAYGVDVILTPGINIMRNPLCGRNFEYYSEDPYLTGKMAAALINGIQSKGIGTSLKHFVANNQQTGKKFNDARMSQRTLREIYLSAFKTCVEESHPWSVMGSYNKIAGQFTQTNQELLIKLLRDEWGYKGLVLTDWTVRRPTADLLNARCALMMPGEEEIVQEIIEAVKSGKVTTATLNACVKDVLTVVAKSITAKGWKGYTPEMTRHAAISRKIATDGMVLLKNENNSLPLAKGAKIALFGASAYKSIAGGTGSSNVNKPYVIDISTGLQSAGFAINSRLSEIYRRYVDFKSMFIDKFPDCPDWQKISYHRTVLPEMDLSGREDLIAEELAKCDVAVVVLGRGSGETSDRVIDNDFNLSAAETAMMNKVGAECRKQGKRMVVVMNVCGVVEMESWRNNANAILLAWFPGQECGNAVADIISGKVNPSGRLPMTFPVKYADIPSSKNYPYVGQTEGKNFDYTNYEEGIWIGYRYFSSARRRVAYPFGYGLSYTSFSYSEPKISKSGSQFTIKVTITNTGNVAGKEVAELYVKAPSSKIDKPESELKAFAKTKILAPNESETVILRFTVRDLASFDEENSRWLTEKGTYSAMLCKSAATDDVIKSISFKISKESSWKVANILAPVEPIKMMKCDEVQSYPKNQIRDLALIYQGGVNRIDWTAEQFLPYVTHKFADGHRDWFFDGFLFLDFNDGRGNSFIPVFGAKKARKVEWEWYLDRLFEKGKSLDALDECISQQKKLIGNPEFKHKVVLTVPTPLADQTDWGCLGNRILKFDNYGDRTAAASWFIDQLVSRFNDAKYENLELTGLYWVDEDICHTKDLTKYVAPAVHAKGLEFIWIPYYQARGYDHWRELGFDMVYYQPNHFFDKKIPDTRLDDACNEALDLGMAMEFECDAKALYGAKDSSYDRMQAYINAFRRHKVFDTSAIAYYTGSKGFIDMEANPCRENQRIMDELAKIVIDRRKIKNLDVNRQ